MPVERIMGGTNRTGEITCSVVQGSSSIMGKVSVQLLAAFLVSAVSLQVLQAAAQGNSAQRHLALMESSVKDIALKLADIYNTTCGPDPQTCPCSQLVCQPVPKDSISCLNTAISDLYKCDAYMESTNRSCSSIKVMNTRSSVIFVRTVNLNTDPTDVQETILCRTQQLDPTFINISKRTEIFASYYQGTVDGSFRTFPGMEDDCGNYDSRKRPWYTGGISYPNYLVILIDCGHDMGKDSTEPGTGKTRLDDARELALQLLDTVYDDDYVDVITFGADLDDTYNRSVQVKVNFSNSQEHPELESLKTKIKSLSVAAESTTTTRFLTGLNNTLIAFDDTTLPNFGEVKRLQNVILFTDGSFANTGVSTSESVVAVLNQLRSNNVRLFIYGINAGSGAQNLQSLADRVNVVYENVTNVDNPLYYVRSYFGYLALSHRNLYNDKPFWGPDYEDFFGVGPIVTVTMPAFTKSDQFLGVAAIDVILNELPFLQDFKAAVIDRRNQQDETYSTASNEITFPVPAVLDDSSCKYDTSNLLCPSTEMVPGETLQGRKCCNTCGVDPHNYDKADSKNLKTLAIILGSVFGVTGLAGFAICCFQFCRPRKGKVKAPATVAGSSQPRGQQFVVGGTRDGTAGQTVWTQPL